MKNSSSQIFLNRMKQKSKSYSLFTKKQRNSIENILIKTNKALNKIKCSEIPKNVQKSSFNGFQTINTIQKHYSMLLKCNQIKLGLNYSLNLQPHTQEYFFLDMELYLFPIMINISKITHDCILYLGFNKTYPGIEEMRGSKKIKKLKNQLKFQIRNPQIIEIIQPSSLNPNKIYLMIHSMKKSVSLTFRIQEKDNPITIDQKQTFFKNTKNNFLNQFNRTIRSKTQTVEDFSITKASYLHKIQMIKEISQSDLISSFIKPNKSFNNKQTIEKLQSSQNNLIKSSSRFLKTHSYRNGFLLSTNAFSNVQQKNQLSKVLTQNNLIYHEKLQKIYQIYQKNKDQFFEYEKEFQLKRLKQKKLTRKITSLFNLSKFIQKSRNLHKNRKNKLWRIFGVNLKVFKFIKNMKQARIQSIKKLPNNKIRQFFVALPILQFISSTIYKKNVNNSEQIILSTFQTLCSSLYTNILFDKSIDYIKKIKLIQIKYKQRFQARKRMLKIYCKKTVIYLFEKNPHFIRFQDLFYEQKAYQKLIKIYTYDQIQKHNQNLMEYKSLIAQRLKFIKFNEKIRINKEVKKISPQKNKKLSPIRNIKKKQMKLQIPNLPNYPEKHFFRNLNILKSMLRNWFQIQNQIYLKQQKLKRPY